MRPEFGGSEAEGIAGCLITLVTASGPKSAIPPAEHCSPGDALLGEVRMRVVAMSWACD
jgi:hypothetical protein